MLNNNLNYNRVKKSKDISSRIIKISSTNTKENTFKF